MFDTADTRIDTGPVLCVNQLELPSFKDTARRKDLQRLAEFLGWRFYSEHPLPEEIKDNVPCAVLDEAEGVPVLLVYKAYKTEEITHSDGVEEKWVIASTYWNPFNEIHDAFQLVENSVSFELCKDKTKWAAARNGTHVGYAMTAAEAICASVLCFLELG